MLRSAYYEYNYPMRILRGLPFLLLLLPLLLPGRGSANAQAQDYEYFDETGHNVQGEFLQFYQQASNPTLIYGYPVTEEFTASEGLQIQYFQRARFELHPGLEEGRRVVATDLGVALYSPSNPLNIYNPLGCRYYSETGYSICFEFWEFFDANGGVEQFGLPISPFEYRQDTIVQYFQKARFEWQPWLPPGQRVVLADLGRIYFDRLGEDPGLLAPVKPLNASMQPAVLSLRVKAFVQKAVTLPQDEQTIYIVVHDQRGQGLAGAACLTRLEWPDGHLDVADARTDSHGVARLQFSFNSRMQGSLISAEVSCGYQDLESTTRASFRIWY